MSFLKAIWTTAMIVVVAVILDRLFDTHTTMSGLAFMVGFAALWRSYEK